MSLICTTCGCLPCRCGTSNPSVVDGNAMTRFQQAMAFQELRKRNMEIESELTALRSQVAELQAKLDEQGKQDPVAYGVANSAITGKAHALMMVRLEIPSDAQYPQLWEPLYRLPPNTEAMVERAREEERSDCAALAMEMFHSAAQGDEIADAIRARK